MAAIVTVTPDPSKRYPQRIGTRLEWEGTITGPASYTTGGDTLSPKLLGMTAIIGGVFSPKAGVIVELIPQTDGTAKLKMYSGALAEVANATNESANAWYARITGR
jgi:hypothetical protein